MNKTICNNCNAINVSIADYCHNCGYKIPKSIKIINNSIDNWEQEFDDRFNLLEDNTDEHVVFVSDLILDSVQNEVKDYISQLIEKIINNEREKTKDEFEKFRKKCINTIWIQNYNNGILQKIIDAVNTIDIKI